jgi:hypothetical protein
MATVLRNVYCSACFGTHTLCLPDPETLFTNREYEFDCPRTRRTVRLPKEEWGEVDAPCPAGSQILREVKQQT